MNKSQKLILAIGALIMIGLILFPTWSISAYGFEIDNTRKFIYTNHILIIKKISQKNDIIKALSEKKSTKINVSLNYNRLISEVAIIFILTVVCIVLLNKQYYKFKK